MADLLDQLKAALANRYTIERELGRGGMATVYLAQDLKHGRRVAVKVLHPELAAALGPERFLREIRLVAQLTHPHILPLHDSGEADGFLFYVMPFVEGESLRDRLNREKQLPVGDAVLIAREVADALSYAHSHDVVHRDIKPENILLEAGHAVVSDFGIARAITAAAGEKLTATGIAVGTPVYMSPEQAAGERDLDGRSDLYSLACVLYEMLAGEPPFTGPTAQVVSAKRLTGTVPPLRVTREAVPPYVEHAVMKSLSRVPADRFATATQFADALGAPTVQGPEQRAPASAVRAPPAVRSRKRFGLAAVIAGALAAGAWWLLHTFPAGRGARAVSGHIASLAVLPLDNFTGDTAQEYFVDGMTEELIADLSRIGSLRVISRRSVMAYKAARKPLPEIARALNVDAVMEGSVLRAGNRVRITAQLIEAVTDRNLWAGSYEREVQDVLSVQSGVARAITQEVAARLRPQEQTHLSAARPVNPEAHEAYLLGRYFWNKRTEEGLKKALGFFQQAIGKDSNYAPAYAGIADYYNVLPFYSRQRPEEVFARAKDAALTALKLDETLAEGHAALAYVRAYYDWNWPAAETEFRRALELNPSYAGAHHSYSRFLTAMGRHEEALAELKRAQELDPLSLLLKANLGMIYYFTRQYDQAIAQVQKTIELDSTFPVAHWGLGLAYEQKGMHRDAIVAIEKSISLAGRDPNFIASLGHVYAMRGMRREVQQIIDELAREARRSYVSSYHVALLYAGLGEKDRAFDWLDKAAVERSGLLIYLNMDPRLDNLRSDQRFQGLLRRVGLLT